MEVSIEYHASDRGPRVNVELQQDALGVMPSGVRADRKNAGDITIRRPADEQERDVGLARRETKTTSECSRAGQRPGHTIHPDNYVDRLIHEFGVVR